MLLKLHTINTKKITKKLELVAKELNDLAAILHV